MLSRTFDRLPCMHSIQTSAILKLTSVQLVILNFVQYTSSKSWTRSSSFVVLLLQQPLQQILWPLLLNLRLMMYNFASSFESLLTKSHTIHHCQSISWDVKFQSDCVGCKCECRSMLLVLVKRPKRVCLQQALNWLCLFIAFGFCTKTCVRKPSV